MTETNQKRKIVKVTFFTDDEFKIVQEMCRASGLGYASLLRISVLHYAKIKGGIAHESANL